MVKDDTGLEPKDVATLPIVLATSVRALKEVAHVKAGDKVLVQAGASGSGSMHIQVAKSLGAEVAATIRSADKSELVRSIGADLVINMRDENLVSRVMQWTNNKGADVVIDNLGGDVLAKSLDAVKPHGIVVAFGHAAGVEVKFDILKFFYTQKQLLGSVASDVRDLEWGLKQVREGRIRPVLDRVLPLSQAAEAHKLIAANQVKGNIVLLPWTTSEEIFS